MTGCGSGRLWHSRAVPQRIRLIEPDDAARLTELLVASREYLAPWEPVRDADYFTVDGQRRVAELALDRHDRGEVVPWVILDDAGDVAGRLTLSDIVRGAFQSCNMGYWVGMHQAGKGLATGAVRAAVEAAFGQLGLHRIQAGTLVDNLASQRVLAKAGFEPIGLAPRYLRIAGAWRDHLLFQRIDDAGGGREAPPIPAPARTLPRQVGTEHLLLGAARVDDAAEQVAAVNASWAELRAWLPWAKAEQTLEEAEENLRVAAAAFEAGIEFNWIIREASTGAFIGRVSVFKVDWRIPKGEIGYWLATSHVGHGYMREAVAAIVAAADKEGFRRLEIRCDALNERSTRVAKSVGFAQDARLVNDDVSTVDATALRDTLVFSRTR